MGHAASARRLLRVTLRPIGLSQIRQAGFH
jgi:hypothetical protein